MRLDIKITIGLLILATWASVTCKKEYLDAMIPPKAIAGADINLTLPLDSVVLDGGASSDADGTIIDYKWQVISGPSTFTIGNPSVSKTVIKDLIAGVYQIELTITDDDGLMATDILQINVVDPVYPNRPPVADAGPDLYISSWNQIIVLAGTGSYDPDNNIAQFTWTKISGPPSYRIINNTRNEVVHITELTQGNYKFELKVTDAGGLSSADTVLIVFDTALDSLSLANAGPDIVLTLPLDSVYLFGRTPSQSSPFHWSMIAGPSGAVLKISDLSNPGLLLVKGLIVGNYSFRFAVDYEMATYSDTVNVLVVHSLQEPNTITFLNLKWRLADEYGTGSVGLDFTAPPQPNLFMTWDSIRPLDLFIQIDPGDPWHKLPYIIGSNDYYGYDAAKPHIWVFRQPIDESWVGKESSLKIKLLQ